jgi:hypothetical protein
MHLYVAVEEAAKRGGFGEERYEKLDFQRAVRREHSVDFREHSVDVREHSVDFRGRSVNFREHSVDFREHSVDFR